MNTTGTNARRNKWIFLLFICVCTLFMGIGYATIDSIDFNISGDLLAKQQEGVFITDVTYDTNINAEPTSSEIVRFYKSILNSNIVLSDSDTTSSITYNVTVYNRNESNYRFTGVTYDDGFYNNENIVFDLSINKGEIVSGKDSLTFSITFKYKDNVDITGDSFSSSLNSVLKFNFELDTTPLLADGMLPIYYSDGNWKKTASGSSNWYDYYNGQWANALTYNHNIAYNQVNNIAEQKVFNGTSDYITLGSANYDFKNNITLAAKIKIAEHGSATQIILGNVESAGFYLGLTSANKLRVRFYDAEGASYDVTYNHILELNDWYNVVATYDGSNIKLYVNGLLAGIKEFTAGMTVSEAPIVIGGNAKPDGTVSSTWFRGTIAEVIVMDEAISEADIMEDYGEEFKHIPTKHSVLYYLKFDGGNGLVCNGAEYHEEGMLLDGTDDYISVGYSDYDFKNSFSIGARVKMNSYSDKEYTIFGNPQNAGFNLFKSTDNKFEVAVYDQNTSSYINQETSFTPELNTWYTLIATYDGNSLKLYVNGIEHTSINANIEMKVCTTPFMISVNANLNSKLGGGYFDGIISEALLVDEALTAEQIATHYASNLRSVVSDKTMVSYDLRSYESREEGTVIPDEIINTMWVWIPRFSATTPTSLGIINTKIVGITDDAHDAFTFDGQELEGFWIGKFENSTNFNLESLENTISIKPNRSSWTNNTIMGMFNTIKSISVLPEKYGFGKDSMGNIDTHMIKNSEWAAVAYFAQGSCGISREGEYVQIEQNDSGYLTGGDNYIDNVMQSTTGNVYGVYDMAGGASEFVMGNYNNTTNVFFETLPELKYYNVYTTRQEYMDNNLQHSLFETYEIYNKSESNFVTETNIWLVRDNLFSYNSVTGDQGDNYGSRSVLIIK